MIVLFEDGRLKRMFRLGNVLNGIVSGDDIYSLDATVGVTRCRESLDKYKEFDDIVNKENGKHMVLYTNCILALNSQYTWDDSSKMYHLYLRDSDGQWRNVKEFTHRELRYAHNLMKMYLAGSFREVKKPICY